MTEAVHLPGFGAITIRMQDSLQPRVCCPHALSQDECLLNAVLILAPEHFEDLLLLERVTASERIGEDGAGANRWQLPEVTRKDDIDASERPAGLVFFQQHEFTCRSSCTQQDATFEM